MANFTFSFPQGFIGESGGHIEAKKNLYQLDLHTRNILIVHIRWNSR